MSKRAENGGGDDDLPRGKGVQGVEGVEDVEGIAEIEQVAPRPGAEAATGVEASLVKRRETLRFEDGARPTGPALDGRTPTPAGLTPSLVSESSSILFDGQAAGYRLGRRLPGSDDVYQATHPRFEGRLVIKLFRRARGLDPLVVEAFLADTSATSSLRHPHIVQVVDAGVLRDGTPFVVAELLAGQTLEVALEEREGPITSGALGLVRGMASALTAAHSVGIAHRELRPDNVFIAELAGYKIGFAKLMDFGVFHIDAAADAGRARGEARRISTYLAPEQWQAGGVAVGDARSDQFALAALAHRLMAPGKPPLARSETGAVLGPVVLSPRMPALETVLGKALDEDPARRFDSVTSFFRAFEDSVSGATILAQLASESPPSDEPAPAPSARPAATVLAPAPRSSVAKTVEIVLPADDAVFPPSPEDARPPRRGTPRPGERGERVERVERVERGSLTQQFFVEGERQEATRFKNAQFERQPSSNSLAFDSFDRVPRRRAPLWAGLFLVGAVAIATVLTWQGARLRGPFRDSSLAHRLGWSKPHVDREVRVGVGPERAFPAPAAAAPREPAPPIEPPQAAATPPPPPPVVVPAPEAAPAPPQPSAQVDVPAAVNGSSPVEERTPKGEAPVVVAPPTSRPGSAPPARGRPRPRSTALHGYIWSPQLQQMVPAHPAWPPPAELPPTGTSPPAPAAPAGAPPKFEPGEPGEPRSSEGDPK